MDKKFSWSHAAIYASLAVCLTAAVAGGWFLLSRPDTEPPQPVFQSDVTEIPTVPAATQPAQALPVPEEEPIPLPETVSMPEEEIEALPVPVFDPTPVEAEPPRIIVEPLVGEVVAAFSVNELQYDPTFQDWRIHDGIDIASASGTAVLSASDGTVTSVAEDPMMGMTVVIDHGDGYRTTYANLAPNPAVSAGESVCAGAVIGAVGESSLAESARGSHLHFSVTLDGDTVDPHEYLHQ